MTAASSADSFRPFDVIAIKPNISDSRNTTFQVTGAALSAINISVTMLIANAYGVRPGAIAALPKWAENARYDIQAKVSEPNPISSTRALSKQEEEEQWRINMRTILDRFRVQVHYENVNAPVYELIKGSGGPKFGVAEAPAGADKVTVSRGLIEGSAISMASLCESLANHVERNVIDKTGLTGEYKLRLTWSPDMQAGVANEHMDADAAPDLFTAIQEELGLRLVSNKGTVRRLVVDQIHPPEPN